jgi:hypothetical protein
VSHQDNLPWITWLQPYVYHNIRKYEVMLAFAMPKYVLFIIFHYKKRSCIKKVNEIVTNMQTNEIT